MEHLTNLACDLWNHIAFRIASVLVIVATVPVYFLSCVVEVLNR